VNHPKRHQPSGKREHVRTNLKAGRKERQLQPEPKKGMWLEGNFQSKQGGENKFRVGVKAENRKTMGVARKMKKELERWDTDIR